MVMATHFGAALADVLISRARVEVPAEQAPEMFDKPPQLSWKVAKFGFVFFQLAGWSLFASFQQIS